MPVDIETWRIKQFAASVNHLLEDAGGKLRSAVTVQTGVRGEGAVPVDQVGTTEGQIVTQEDGDTPDNTVETDRPWVYPVDLDWGHRLKRFENLRTGIDPQGPFTRAGTNAVRRLEDRVILQNFFAPRKTGRTGATTRNFPASSQDVGVNVGGGGGATGLNHDKIRGALEILLGNEADVFDGGEEVHALISETEWNQMFAFNQTTSQEFTSGNGGRPIDTGRLPMLYGVRWHVFSNKKLENAGLKTNNTLALPFWLKSGMHMSIWADRQINVYERGDKKGVPHIYICQTIGATRLEEAKIVRVNVDRSA